MKEERKEEVAFSKLVKAEVTTPLALDNQDVVEVASLLLTPFDDHIDVSDWHTR